jgi:hypothetical protein
MKKKTILAGVLLILGGLYFLIDALPMLYMPAGSGMMIFGAWLLISRVVLRKRSLLSLAGFILLSIGTSRLMLTELAISGKYAIVATPLALSLSFFLTHIFEYRRLGNWPIIPALVLLVFSAAFFLILTPAVNAVIKPYYGTILPLLLIIVGIVLLIRGAVRGKKPVHAQKAPFEDKIPDPANWAQPPVQPEAPAAAAETPAAPAAETPVCAEEPVTVKEPVVVVPVEAVPVAEAAAEEAPAAETPADLPAEPAAE